MTMAYVSWLSGGSSTTIMLRASLWSGPRSNWAPIGANWKGLTGKLAMAVLVGSVDCGAEERRGRRSVLWSSGVAVWANGMELEAESSALWCLRKGPNLLNFLFGTPNQFAFRQVRIPLAWCRP